MAFKIEKGIPIPDKKDGCGRPSIYPFQEMEVGDSFPISSTDAKKVSNAARTFGQRHGKLFIVRKDGRRHRVWRTK